jgi:hypothetical protein
MSDWHKELSAWVIQFDSRQVFWISLRPLAHRRVISGPVNEQSLDDPSL